MNNDSQLFRDLMDKYQNKLYKLKKEYEEAKDDQDTDAILAGEVLIKNMHAVIFDLFATMKRAKMLTKEEEEFGALKN